MNKENQLLDCQPMERRLG